MLFKRPKKEYVINAGGSGGHVVPALAILEGLTDSGVDMKDILFVGGDLGLEGDIENGSVEQKLFQDKNVDKEFIRAGKLQRTFSWLTIKLFLRTVLGFCDSFKIFLKYKPKKIISLGGYVTVPVALMGKLFGAKVYLHEQTAAVGLSNKVVGYLADIVFVNFESSKRYFPRTQVIHTGNPIRDIIFDSEYIETELASQVKSLEELDDDLLVYITGGGLGSHLFNKLVKNNLENLLKEFKIILQVGDNSQLDDYKEILDEIEVLSDDLKKRILVTKFVSEEIGYVLNIVDIVVARGGAGTITELGALRKRCVLIPIKWVTHNEQYKNSKILADLGLAKILDEDNIKVDVLIETVKGISKQEISENDAMKRLFPRNAVTKIVNKVREN
jgi:UDP-N-acetylglucosamine--N-acetylmuramyl-(pentapeptide) pyrophosphoryl-undecaprenol N-acetylglucosamine transferase